MSRVITVTQVYFQACKWFAICWLSYANVPCGVLTSCKKWREYGNPKDVYILKCALFYYVCVFFVFFLLLYTIVLCMCILKFQSVFKLLWLKHNESTGRFTEEISGDTFLVWSLYCSYNHIQSIRKVQRRKIGSKHKSVFKH